jgi:peptide-methionine (S)-S-oxide reductase
MQSNCMPQIRSAIFPRAIAASAIVCWAGLTAPLAAGPLPKPERDLPVPAASGEPATAVLAGGCFWCVEAVFEQLDGVSSVVSGYAGGDNTDANYKAVSAGKTRHAEAVKITYDPAKISYGTLLRVFFATHDPTTRDRQGPDRGPQYRSAIFYATDEQKDVAQAYIRQLDRAKAFDKPIVTTLERLEKFHPAEDYHQDFVARNPAHPYVRAWVPAKLKKLREQYPELVTK